MRYGMIGNCKSAALVHENGSIEWCCLPNFDSPSSFARLLDPQGGYFQVSLPGKAKIKQTYLPQTNILETEFDDGENAFAVVDFMPRYREGEQYRQPIEIHRLLLPRRGKPEVQVIFEPRLNYAQGPTQIKLRPSLITASHRLESLFLYSSLPLESIIKRKPIALTEDHYLLLTYHEKLKTPEIGYSLQMFQKTREYWETWSSHCRLPSKYSAEVLRSALVLKLMTFQESGAIIAAPTTSLPEILGEGRNWDYRYCWLRDSSLMLEALKSIGHFEEARSFIHFLLRIFESKQTHTQILYGIDGRTQLVEKLLPHLRGYKDSPPVRIGNGACHTIQHDIYGEMLQTLYLYYFHYQFEKMTDDVWSLVKFLVHTISQVWQTPDAGIWEFRNQTAHFSFSKVLAWVALDRGVKMAQKIGKDYAVEQWGLIAGEIKRDILSNAWREDRQAYTQSYQSPHLDASLLLMQHYGFLETKDPRWKSTVLGCEKELVKNGFGFRYTSDDDLGKPKSALLVAAIWLAQALHSIGKKERAIELFENVLRCANHLGLLSEDVDPGTGELLGNFPQAYSHMAVINAANAFQENRETK